MPERSDEAASMVTTFDDLEMPLSMSSMRKDPETTMRVNCEFRSTRHGSAMDTEKAYRILRRNTTL